MLNPTKSLYGADIERISQNGGAKSHLAIKTKNNLLLARIKYIEAQIFGGISLKDIDFLILPSYLPAEFPELLKLLSEANIFFKIRK